MDDKSIAAYGLGHARSRARVGRHGRVIARARDTGHAGRCRRDRPGARADPADDPRAGDAPHDNQWDDLLADALAGPLSACIVLVAFIAALPWIPVAAGAEGVLRELARSATVVTVVWGAFRCIELARTAAERRPWAIQRPASRSLLRLGARFAKVTVLMFGLLVGLAQLGVSVASLIAGLGIGGLVLASLHLLIVIRVNQVL